MKGGMIHKALCSGKGGGGSQTEEKYDRIAGLPTVFSFDMADGWRCELCADSNPTDCPKTFSTRYDSWSTEYQSTIIYTQITKSYYLRIFSGSELKLITDVLSFNDSCAKWYASNGTAVGDLMKTVEIILGDFGVNSAHYYVTDALSIPYVFLDSAQTTTTNGIVETANSIKNILSPQTKFISNGDIDVNVYADFVKAVRKFSDEFNNNNTT